MNAIDAGKPAKVADRVYASIKQMVISYDIRPGQQIPIEDLAEHLLVSVTPVREALNRLLNDGLITRRAARGFYNRDIDLKELTDLFQLRGSLAVSAFLFVLRSDMRQQIPDLLQRACQGGPNKGPLPICATMIHALGNREMQRIYNNVVDKIHFVWQIYAASEQGAQDIAAYRADLYRLLTDQDLAGCIDVIDRNIKNQVNALEPAIQHGLGLLFSQSPPFPRNAATII
jgi:DNA-binding GntR family transcriptional regulator